MCNYMLTFLRNSHHLTFPPALYKSSSCSAPFLVLGITCLFIFSHWLIYSGASLCFNLHFREDSRCEYRTFACAYWPLCIFVCDVFVQIFCLFKLCLPLLDCKVVFKIRIWVQVLYQYLYYKCFLPVCGLLFHFLITVFRKAII